MTIHDLTDTERAHLFREQHTPPAEEPEPGYKWYLDDVDGSTWTQWIQVPAHATAEDASHGFHWNGHHWEIRQKEQHARD